MKRNMYYFIIRSGNYDQMEREIRHWACSNEFTSKKDLQKNYTSGRQNVKMNEIYSTKQMIEKFSKHSIDEILKEIKKMQSCVYIAEN